MLKGGRIPTASSTVPQATGITTTSVITTAVLQGLDVSLPYGFDWTCSDPHLKTGCLPDSTTDDGNYAYVGSNGNTWT